MTLGMPATITTAVGFLLALGIGWSLAESFRKRYLLNFLAQEMLD